MNKTYKGKFRAKTDLGNKVLIRTYCGACRTDIFEVADKGKKIKYGAFYCEDHKE